jgi:hypothetical protein
MATQRLTIASIAGRAAAVAETRFRSWRDGPAPPDPAAVDDFCVALRANGAMLPVVYFAEWVDRWLMGDTVPGPGSVAGRLYEATCLSPDQAAAWAGRCGRQFPEQRWLASRLREAAAAWAGVAQPRAIVVLREILGGSTTDDEVLASVAVVPDWLAMPDGAAED